VTPLTEEIRLQIFGSPDYHFFPGFLLSDGDSVYSRENSIFFFLNVTGIPVKTCLKFWQS